MSGEARWRLAAASAVGSAHRLRGEACQDASAYDTVVLPSGARALALIASDGAGSAVRGGEGARLACANFVEAMREADAARLEAAPYEWLASFLTYHCERVDRTAFDAGLSRRDYASTLLAVLVAPGSATYWQVGDGAIVTRDGTHAYETAFWPLEGEFAGETTFVTDERALATACCSTRRTDAVEIALFTDGLQRLVLDFSTRGAHEPFFAKMFAILSEEPPGSSARMSGMLAEYLASPQVDARTDDDRTLVLAQFVP